LGGTFHTDLNNTGLGRRYRREDTKKDLRGRE